MPFTFKLSQRLARMRCSAVVLTIAALAACEKPVNLTDTGTTITQLVVSPRAVTLRTDQVVDLMAVAFTSAGDTAPVTVSWSVTGGTVINTSTSGGRHYGKFKAGADTGKVKVIARGQPGGTTDTSVVTVTAVPVSAVTITPASVSVLVGQSAQLAATTVDSAGNALTGRTVTWTSNNSSVVMVNGSGLVTSVAAGSTTINAVSEGHSGTASISVSNVPVASVTVTPATASLSVGGTQPLVASAKDANGNALTGRTITWTTSNSGVATVNGSGLVGASAAGSATITATSEGKGGTATVTVTAPVSAPGTVTDLAVSGMTDTSATLSFTEVTEGSGQPARYDVRYAAGTISWGSATEVTRGSCSTPLAGTTVGARRTCTVLGLTASTAYGFQLVAFRGTLGVDAVFGSPSNGASGTTGAGAPKPVASVTLSPATASITIGGTQQFTATLRDASGTLLSGRTISWTSDALNVASVSASGLGTALLAGAATITATSEGRSGTATLTVTAVPPPPPPGWPHEPSGLGVLSDYGFGTPIPVTQADVAVPDGSGWSSIYNGNGYGSIVTDPAAPMSGGPVFQLKYPVGFAGGTSPASLYRNLPNTNQLYAGFWWKPSNPWQGHASNVNKIAFVFPGSSGDIYIAMYGQAGGPYELRVLPEFPGLPISWYVPNVTQLAVTLGQWHRIEWFMDKSAGILRWWLDGQLIGDYANVPFPSSAFNIFEISSTWGGMGDTKTETDYYWFDHVRVSGR